MTKAKAKAKATMSRVTAYSSNGDIHSEEFHRGFIVMGFDEDCTILWQDLNGVKFNDIGGVIRKVMELDHITINDLTDPTIKVRFVED